MTEDDRRKWLPLVTNEFNLVVQRKAGREGRGVSRGRGAGGGEGGVGGGGEGGQLGGNNSVSISKGLAIERPYSST